MSKLNKILIIPVVLCGFLFNFSLADNSDCGTFAVMDYSKNSSFSAVDNSRWTDYNKYSKFLSIEQQKAIIDKESLNTAILNLKKYCCENGLWGLSLDAKTCKDDKVFFNDNIIDSPYLFDHLFDVEMRRLSWLTGEYDIYKKTNMWSDDKWLEWRAWINEQAENVSWANPQIIINKYKEFWQPSSPSLWYDISKNVGTTFWDLSDDSFLTYVSGQWESQESTGVAEALKNYDKWTLYDRYNNACAITEYLYALLDLSWSSDDKRRVINNVSEWVCNNIVKGQIQNESSYVQVVILQAGNLFLQNYRQWYLSYLYDRGQNLQKIWGDSTEKFLDVVRGVPNLVKNCVK